MLRLLIFLAFVASSLSSPVVLAAPSGSGDAFLSSDFVYSLRVEHSKVAAGGMPDAAHQAAFVLGVSDMQGQPLVGVPVQLSTLWDGRGQITSSRPKKPWSPPFVTWDKSVTSVNQQAVTDKNGEALGIFTSGQQQGKVTLRAADAEATIEQVWGENQMPGGEIFIKKDPNRPGGFRAWHTARYEMSFWRNKERNPDKDLVMISGHTLNFKLTSVTFSAYARAKADYYNWKVVAPDPNTATVKDKERWATILSWAQIEEMRETAPGIYEGSYSIELPKEPLFFEEKELMAVTSVDLQIEDESVWTEW